MFLSIQTHSWSINFSAYSQLDLIIFVGARRILFEWTRYGTVLAAETPLTKLLHLLLWLGRLGQQWHKCIAEKWGQHCRITATDIGHLLWFRSNAYLKLLLVVVFRRRRRRSFFFLWGRVKCALRLFFLWLLFFGVQAGRRDYGCCDRA